MSLDARDQSIITQVAAKIASDLAVAARDTKIEDLVSDWAVALPTVAEALFEQIATKQTETAASSVIAAFPGSVVVPASEGWQPADFNTTAGATPQPPLYVPQAAPTPIPGVTDGDPATNAMWIELQQNPSAWYDNRTGKTNPRAPDFKHRTQGTSTTGNKSLWIVSKKNPSWVPQLVANLRF